MQTELRNFIFKAIKSQTLSLVLIAILLLVCGSFSRSLPIRHKKNCIVIKKYTCDNEKLEVLFDTIMHNAYIYMLDSFYLIGNYHSSGFSSPEVILMHRDKEVGCGFCLNTYMLSMDTSRLYSRVFLTKSKHIRYLDLDPIFLGNITDTSGENFDYSISCDSKTKSIILKQFEKSKNDTFFSKNYNINDFVLLF